MPTWNENPRDLNDEGAFDRLSRLVEQDEHQLQTAFQTAYSHEGLALPNVKDPGVIARSFASEQNNPLKFVNDFVSKNSDLFGGKSKSDNTNDLDLKSIEDSINGFSDAAKTLIKGLHALGQIHPFIGVAVGAFALVVTMDFTRRENDRKVLAVKVQMQELMIVFFELRHIRNSRESRHDGICIADRLKTFMLEVASDIKKCGSACDAYLKKGFLGKFLLDCLTKLRLRRHAARTVKATIYEARLADFAQKFLEHRSTLGMALSLHTTIGVDAANGKLDSQDQLLKRMDKKLDMILLFRKLDTPREKEVMKFIEEHGGVKACLNNDEYLEELVAKSGDSLSRISGRGAGGSGRRSNDLPEIRKRLNKEFQEDIDEAFNRNMVLFERKLDMQNKQLNETLRQESDHIISVLLTGAHDRINDSDLRKLWKDMGWKGSVKARTFVLNLHDYYAEQRNRMDARASLISPLPTPPSARMSPILPPSKKLDDKWALAYINAAYVQSILEAVDDDGTGYISIKEVNTFVEERPSGWSLPEWFAYWAVGWQISITQYKSKIYGLVQSMFEMLEYVLPSNRRGVDEYLFHPSFWRIELILRSTRSVNPKMLSDPDLVRYTDMYTAEEEKRLKMNLEEVGYELDTTATVSLVTGEGRIERFVYPLLYLLLKRHLRVLSLACKHVLDTEEFVSLNESLVSVLLAVDTRIQNLEAVFKQTHFDIQARLGNFAFGLLQLSYGDIRRVPAQVTFGTWSSEEDVTPFPKVITRELIDKTLATTTYDILKYGHRDGFQSTDYFEFEPHRRKHLGTLHPLERTWTGHNVWMEGEDTITYILRLSILVEGNRKIYGKGEDFNSTFEFSGYVNPVAGRRSRYDFSFTLIDDEDGLQRECSGQLDAVSSTIIAQWSDRRMKDDPQNIAYRPFQLTSTPPSLTRYRYTPEAFAEDSVRARWNFACAATRHMAQEKMWSRGFLEERAMERKRYVELSTRSLIVTMGLTPQKPLSAVEKGELDQLRRNLNPSEGRFYQALADFEIQKLPWHPAWGCDWCERRITKARNLCITCMSEDLSDNIDLCSACVEKSPSKRGFVHDPSHIMVKVEQTLHDFYFPRVVENAKVTIERMKILFRMIEANALQPDENADPEAESNKVICACCAKKVTPPCWACVTCARDTFICNECDTKKVLPLKDGSSPSHKLSHPLVRIRDTSLSGQAVSTEDRLNALEQRLIMLEHKVAEGFAAIDAKFENRIARLETRVEERLAKLETHTEERFDTIEAVLRQIMAQTMALPAIYGQVVRDTVRHSMPPQLYPR